MDRPDDTTLAVNITKLDDTKTNSKNISKHKKDKKHAKVETRLKIPLQKTNNQKHDKINLSIEEKESEEEVLKVQFTNLIEDFIVSADTSKHLSSDLNPNERRLMHECADLFNIIHLSEGQGKERHIVLKKFTSTDNENLKKVEENEKKNPQMRNASDVKDKCDMNLVSCANCHKEMPKTNMQLHKLRCASKFAQPEQSKPKIDQNKVKKNKKKERQEETEDDFDAICEQFATMNKICNFSGCKTKVAIIGADCKFCRIRFCLSHSMAELHGCGDAAKRAARQQIQKEHKLYPGSGTQSKGLDQVKRKQIQRKLDKKIENLTEARKSNTQDKASK